jgi:hypothetical protein
MKPAIVVDFWKITRRLLLRLRAIWVILLVSLLLSGCVDYDVGINFAGVHRGTIVQQIELEERLTNFSGAQVQEWLESIERRARQLQGKTKRLSERELIVTIPFSSGAELESKFNRFFNPVERKQPKPPKAAEALDLPTFESKFHLDQGNFLLVERNHLSYDLDLRSLGVLSNDGKVLVSPGSLLDLRFRVEAPWGARNVNRAIDMPRPETEDGQLVWRLQPGQINHLEAVFWLPSPLGIGTVAIVLLVLAGFYLKYQSLPWSAPPSAPPAVPEGQ